MNKEQLRDAKETLGCSERALAQFAGRASGNTVSRWIAGTADVPDDTAAEIEAAATWVNKARRHLQDELKRYRKANPPPRLPGVVPLVSVSAP